MSITGHNNTPATDPADKVAFATLIRRRRGTPDVAIAFDDVLHARQAGDVTAHRDALITLAAAAINAAERLPA